ncbi:MAG: Dabb family protein [Caldithrix sp.]|nr:MAG: Dabb family protein [Caldithrix sp.]
MIKHIVMWKLKEHAEGCSKLENAQKLKSWLESLADKIAELKFVEVGINFDHSDAAFDVVLYTEFENKQALKSYQAHPEHQRLIKEFLDKIRLEKKVVDYEV